jgi:hypothetical protein
MVSKAKSVNSKATELRAATNIGAISTDLGNGYCNIEADGGISSDWRSVQGIASENNRMSDLPFDSAIHFDGAWRVFGEAAATHTNTIEEFATTGRYVSDWYKRMFAFGLHRAYGLRVGESPFYPKVIASVPAQQYANNDRVDQIRSNLVGVYCIGDTQGNQLQVEVTGQNLIIIPEGAGTYYYMIKKGDQQGKSSYGSGVWAVLDIGYLTSDVVMFRKGDYMEDKAASEASLGMRGISTKIAKYIHGKGGPDLRPDHYDIQLGCDSVRVSGTNYDISVVRDRAVAALGEQLGRFIERTTDNENLDGILLTGGGAERLAPHIKIDSLRKPYMQVVPNARRANVLGAYLMLTEG